MPDSAESTGAAPPIAAATAQPAASTTAGQAAPDPSQPQARPQPGPRSETLTDAIADLMQMAVNYLRQETAGVMRDKVVLPAQKLGMLIAFAFAAAFLLALGIGFVAVALLLVLAHFLGWSGALGLIGGLLLIGAAVFTYLKVRSVQK